MALDTTSSCAERVAGRDGARAGCDLSWQTREALSQRALTVFAYWVAGTSHGYSYCFVARRLFTIPTAAFSEPERAACLAGRRDDCGDEL